MIKAHKSSKTLNKIQMKKFKYKKAVEILTYAIIYSDVSEVLL